MFRASGPKNGLLHGTSLVRRFARRALPFSAGLLALTVACSHLDPDFVGTNPQAGSRAVAEDSLDNCESCRDGARAREIQQPGPATVNQGSANSGLSPLTTDSSVRADGLRLDGEAVLAQPDVLTGLDHYDSDTLFHLAREAAAAGNLQRAEQLYGRLLGDFEGSQLAVATHFNLGLLCERQGRFADAAVHYRAAVADERPAHDGERTWLDAHFRLAVCLGKIGQWWDSVAAFDALLELPSLEDFDRLEAQVGRGIALEGTGDLESADIAFSGALRFGRDARERGLLDDGGMMAEAAFHLGELKLSRYGQIHLEFPIDVLRRRLEDKCELLLSAQSRYLRAIQNGDAHTAAVSGFRIGSMYETLYDEIVNLHVPPELDNDQAEIYREEVRARVQVLVQKALMVYEKSLLAGRRADTAAGWVAKLEAAISRLQTIYLAQGQSGPG